MSARTPEKISPTAHYTSYVWARNGLSHPRLATRQGRIMFEALRPAMTLSGVLGGPTLQSYLLARHRALDALLARAIEQEGVTQVIELACGLSARGWRFSGRYGEQLTYVEADLPEMAERKRQALADMGSLGERHRVQPVDVLRENGPLSLGALVQTMDRSAGLAIVIEGLIGYLPKDVVENVWRRIARQLSAFPVGLHLSDLQLGSQTSIHVEAFRAMLGAFVRSPVSLHHYPAGADAESALERAGFEHAAVAQAAEIAGLDRHYGRGAQLAHVAFARAARGQKPQDQRDD